MNPLKKGSIGQEVKHLQVLLNALLEPSPQLIQDGVFGQGSHDALVRFQQTRGLEPTGLAEPSTWEALIDATSAPWMKVASAELGVHENPAPGQHNQRILEYHGATGLRADTDETPWCSSFINWVMKQAGYSGTNNALAKSWLSWGQALESPRYGAITVIKRKGAQSDAATGSATGYHVAFCLQATGTHIEMLGGNQSDSVRISRYSLGAYEVHGYRWPR
jgi:uncharacterized protein (TIGR02594 family)